MGFFFLPFRKMMDEWIIILKFLRNINLVCNRFVGFINEFLFCILEKPAIDRLLDYIWNQEARKPAIDKLIQEYLEGIGSPLTHQYSSSLITPAMGINICIFYSPLYDDLYLAMEACSQQTQTPCRGIQHYQSAPSFYHTPLTSGNESNSCCNTSYDFQHTASTPLLR
jgi:hypothetical protein